MKKSLKILVFTLILPILLFNFLQKPDGKFKLPGGDARKTPADPKKRVEKNLKEGRGFRLIKLNGLKIKLEVVYLILQVQMNYGEHH